MAYTAIPPKCVLSMFHQLKRARLLNGLAEEQPTTPLSRNPILLQLDGLQAIQFRPSKARPGHFLVAGKSTTLVMIKFTLNPNRRPRTTHRPVLRPPTLTTPPRKLPSLLHLQKFARAAPALKMTKLKLEQAPHSSLTRIL